MAARSNSLPHPFEIRESWVEQQDESKKENAKDNDTFLSTLKKPFCRETIKTTKVIFLSGFEKLAKDVNDEEALKNKGKRKSDQEDEMLKPSEVKEQKKTQNKAYDGNNNVQTNLDEGQSKKNKLLSRLEDWISKHLMKQKEQEGPKEPNFDHPTKRKEPQGEEDESKTPFGSNENILNQRKSIKSSFIKKLEDWIRKHIMKQKEKEIFFKIEAANAATQTEAEEDANTKSKDLKEVDISYKENEVSNSSHENLEVPRVEKPGAVAAGIGPLVKKAGNNPPVILDVITVRKKVVDKVERIQMIDEGSSTPENLEVIPICKWEDGKEASGLLVNEARRNSSKNLNVTTVREKEVGQVKNETIARQSKYGDELNKSRKRLNQPTVDRLIKEAKEPLPIHDEATAEATTEEENESSISGTPSPGPNDIEKSIFSSNSPTLQVQENLICEPPSNIFFQQHLDSFEKAQREMIKRPNSLIPVNEKHFDFEKVQQQFLNGCGDSNKIKVLKIFRKRPDSLYNMHLEGIKKARKELNAGSDSHIMKHLWHGSSEQATYSIWNGGFRRGMHGDGVYFAVKPSYCIHELCSPNKDQVRHILYANVITGRSCPAQAGHKMLPKGFHSTVDNREAPNIYVVYDDWAAYPEFLISFQFTT